MHLRDGHGLSRDRQGTTRTSGGRERDGRHACDVLSSLSSAVDVSHRIHSVGPAGEERSRIAPGTAWFPWHRQGRWDRPAIRLRTAHLHVHLAQCRRCTQGPLLGGVPFPQEDVEHCEPLSAKPGWVDATSPRMLTVLRPGAYSAAYTTSRTGWYRRSQPAASICASDHRVSRQLFGALRGGTPTITPMCGRDTIEPTSLCPRFDDR